MIATKQQTVADLSDLRSIDVWINLPGGFPCNWLVLLAMKQWLSSELAHVQSCESALLSSFRMAKSNWQHDLKNEVRFSNKWFDEIWIIAYDALYMQLENCKKQEYVFKFPRSNNAWYAQHSISLHSIFSNILCTLGIITARKVYIFAFAGRISKFGLCKALDIPVIFQY